MSKFHERVANGKCGVCGVRPVEDGKKKCKKCLEHAREYMRKRRQERKASSVCASCKSPINEGSYCNVCKEDLKKRNKKLGAEYHRAVAKKSREKLRRDVIAAYGGKCSCCGEDEFVFLAVDHIDGGGNQHRKELGGNQRFYAWLRRNEYPSGFQVLCWNCNWAKHHGGCPHKRK
jgi:hypothetical protein